MGMTDLLEERGKKYGDFILLASTAQQLEDRIRGTLALNPAYQTLGLVEQKVVCESLGMICSKIARICHGDSLYKDNWDDIAGYALLISKMAEGGKNDI